MIKTYETYSHLNKLTNKMGDLISAISKLYHHTKTNDNLQSYSNWSGDKCNFILYVNNFNDSQAWIELSPKDVDGL